MATLMRFKLLAHSPFNIIAGPARPLMAHHRRLLFTSLINQCKPLGSSGDFFKVFSIDKKFDLNTVELTRQFRLLQNQWHPDKFVGRTKLGGLPYPIKAVAMKENRDKRKLNLYGTIGMEEKQDLAARESSFINQAYRTLKDPLKRSLYLLKLTGHPLEEGTTDSDPEFLMEIMELNEKLADIKSHEDMESIKKENRAMLDDLQRSFAAAFEAENFQEARKIASRMKYYANISAKVHHFERERGL